MMEQPPPHSPKKNSPPVQLTSQLLHRCGRQTELHDTFLIWTTNENKTQWAAERARPGPNLCLQLSLWKSSLLHRFSRLAGRKFSLKQNSIQVRLRSHSEGGQWDHWSGASRNREDCFADLNWDTLQTTAVAGKQPKALEVNLDWKDLIQFL